jgi:hypothetical protein
MKKISVIWLIFTFIISTLSAQEFSAQKEIKKYIEKTNKSDLKKIEASEKDMISVNQLFSEADKLAESISQEETAAENGSEKDKKKSEAKISKLESKEAQTRITASKAFAKVNKNLFTVYKNNFKSARAGVEGDDAKMQEGRELEQEAGNLYKKAQTKRTQATRISDQLKSYKILADADDLEKQSLDMQLKAYGLYLNWYSTEANTDEANTDETKPEETKTEEETSENKTEINEELPNFVSPNKTETKKEVPEEEVDYSTAKTSSSSGNVSTTSEPEKNQQTILYKIQVAASENPLSIVDLRKIYNYKLMFNNEFENGYYKYSVGQFKSYEEAATFKNSMNVPDAFIIAYRDGQKISIAEANPELVKERGTQNQNSKTVSPNEQGTVFKIQISATKKPATNTELGKMNPTSKQVEINKVGVWYKYTVGNFKTEQEAENFRKQNRLTGFVVKYVNGKEIK